MTIKHYCAAALLCASSALSWASPEGTAKKLHERVAGVPPTPAVWAEMTEKVKAGDVVGAAYLATDSNGFYSSVLKSWAMPWSNEAQTVFEPLNDFVATIIGMVRDDVDFREVLYGDIVYIGDHNKDSFIQEYKTSRSNTHYDRIERSEVPLKDLLMRAKQSAVYQLNAGQTAGVMTTVKGANEYFKDGTNRAMLRFMSKAFLCKDMEELSDVTRPVDRIRQDVDRSPAGETEQYLVRCAGCHAGMDALAGGFAYYDYAPVTVPNSLIRSFEAAYLGRVADKYLINAHAFPNGFVTKDDSWVNYWREGRNADMGWSTDLPGHGHGIKSLGMELAHSEQFSRCQVEKAFALTCMGPPQSGEDKTAINRIMGIFANSGYNMKRVIAETAAYCAQ